MRNLYIKSSFVLLALFMISCYTRTIDDLSEFTVQIPVYFYDNAQQRKVPSISPDFTNLYEYDEYKKNKDRIDRAIIYQFSYWIDTLIHPETKKPFNPKTDEMIFDKITYKLVFIKPINPDNYESQNPDDFMINTDYEPFIIKEFKNAKVTEFYKNPKNIVEIDEIESMKISDALKKNPFFFIVSEYSKYQGQALDTAYFPLLYIRTDLVVRLTVKL